MLYLRRSVLAVIVIASLLVGFAGGFGGGYYKFVYAPKVKAQEMAKKQEEELNKMVRHGEVVSVEPDRLTLKVDKGGGDIGKTITARTTEYTSVQIGMGFVNKPGEKLDLTKWFKQGDYVDVLYKDGQALALHRELRPGEQGPQPPQEPPVQGQQQGQQQQGQPQGQQQKQ
ncbi:hypothetical protein [Desulfofundulus thermosubterraneus]|uniref:Uncharacterized protein n=1 Tax=Desulfofundulus thermosubterraneus DSM 16057 TaxID=1121432 RepID=A0A1M6H1J1_9FIRM|nr:hypothetical protein [Desulfofundulus thermosubterraneus]SHJ16078.1 hypothetical protein SAMN02745219_01889 [Desulfofundulus thermosubterraneus DSM 16057]